MKNKKIIAAALAMALPLSAVACSKETEETTTAPTTAATTTTEAVVETTTEATETTTEETESPLLDALYDPSIPYSVNPVSGLQDMDPANEGHRSVAIVVNNCHAAMPQRGISKADAIYEYETEGGQTRLLAVFADVNTVPEIGSLRSARILSSDLAAGNNSIFIHYGRNARVPDHIAMCGIDHIDGNNCSGGSNNSANATDGYVNLPNGLFFWRDSVWLSQRALEHTAVTDGRHLAEAIEYFNIEAEGETPFLFNYVPESAEIEAADPCSEINVYFSATNDDALFTFDPETGMYTKCQYGGTPQIDQTTGEQIAVRNIMVIFARIQGHGDGTIDAYITDGGSGYYVSDGHIMPITWTKDTPLTPIVMYNEDGEEVEVNRGVSYICIVDDDKASNTMWVGEGTIAEALANN